MSVLVAEDCHFRVLLLICDIQVFVKDLHQLESDAIVIIAIEMFNVACRIISCVKCTDHECTATPVHQ